MTIYHRRQLVLTLADDEELNQTLFVRSRTTSALTGLVEYSSDKFLLADTAGEVPIDMGGVATARLVYVEADGACDLKLDGGQAIELRPISDEVAIMMIEQVEVAAITVQNPTPSSSITVTVVVAGD